MVTTKQFIDRLPYVAPGVKSTAFRASGMICVSGFGEQGQAGLDGGLDVDEDVY